MDNIVAFKQKEQFSYYNYSKLFSYNCTYNFLIGARGLGKTYGIKKKVIKDAIRRGDMFIYLRRYEGEIAAAAPTFFADVEWEFPNHDFRYHHGMAQMAHIETRADKKRIWTDIGFFIALSTAQKLKSVAFPKVKTIIFDEFIIEKGAIHYLPNEADVFNNFFSTVDRYKDKTKVLFLANSVSIMNPYFNRYDIEPSELEEFSVLFDGFMLLHLAKSDEFNNQVYKTKFGKFIKGTDYADYAVANEFIDNGKTLIEFKGFRAKYSYTLETDKGSFSVWQDDKNRQFYVQKKLPKKEVKFTLVPENIAKDKPLLTFNDPLLAYLRTCLRQGRMVFDVPSTRNAFIEIFSR